jgi:AcrR family transcriptional regulator
MTQTNEVQPEQAEQETRAKILQSALMLCHTKGYTNVTTESIAAQAGVPESAVGELWPSKAAVVIDAFRAAIGDRFAPLDTGDFAADLRAQLTAIARIFGDPNVAPHLQQVIGEAQHDETIMTAFHDRVFGPNRSAATALFESAQRNGQIRRDLDLDAAIDLVFAPFWFRLLLHTGPMGDDYAASITDLALAGLR